MGMLAKAEHKMAYAKVGIYGNAGSGKTFTASCIAIGLHKFCKATKPIAFFDTEPALSYVLPLYKAAGIEVLCYDKSRALKDLMDFMEEAEKECSIIIIDSITHIWRDAQESFIQKVNDKRRESRKPPITSLEFQHWRPIKSAWGEFTDKFISSKAHVIVCGRQGAIYDYQVNDNGKRELITTGNRMATEKEMGYEPSLLIEMEKIRENDKVINRAFIEKDRSNILNGKEIDFFPFKGSDEASILRVFDRIKPHFETLNIGGAHFDSMNSRNSKDMYDVLEDGNEWPNEQRQRAIWSEEIQGLLSKHYPGQTADEKKQKMDLLEKFFGTRSWTKVENTNSTKLLNGYESMKAFLNPVSENELNKDKNSVLKKDDIERKFNINGKTYREPKDGEVIEIIDPIDVRRPPLTVIKDASPVEGSDVATATEKEPSPMDAIREILKNKGGENNMTLEKGAEF